MNNIACFLIFTLALIGIAHADDDNVAVKTQLTELRDSFVSQIKAEGFSPSLPPPAIVLDNTPSFGRYDNDQNVVHIAVWSALSEEDQGRFARLAKMLNNGQAPEQVFEDSVHHWVFVHELGHWWQLSQKKLSADHYSVEYGANRIAAAFWRFKDPALMRATENRMSIALARLPAPLLDGRDKKQFFNENYETLGPKPDYIWFQYSMVLGVQGESPKPSFKETLSRPVFP